MAAPRLIALPPELKREIVGYMLCYLDLRNLCLTCKDLRQFATPALYRTVVLHLPSNIPKWLGAFVNPANQGRQYIRKLRITESGSSGQNAQNVLRVIRTVLSGLITDTLEAISFSRENVDCDLILLLLQTQRKLRSLGLPRRISGSPEKIPEDFPWLIPHLQHLHTIKFNLARHLDNSNRFFQMLFTQLPGIKGLRIYTTDYMTPHDKGFNFVETIIGSCWKASAPSRLCRLSSLKLHDVDLSLWGRPYPMATELVALGTLHLVNCLKSNVLLDCMAMEIRRTSHQTFLKNFKYVQDISDDHSTEVLSQFLSSVSALTHVCIDVVEDEPLPTVDSLIAHSQSLKSLVLSRRICVLEDKYYSLEDLEKLCTACTSLEQIAVSLPDFYSDGLGCDNNPGWFQYTKQIHALSLLPRAHTVRILTWPSPPESLDDNFPAADEYYASFVHKLATTIFDELDRCRTVTQRCSPIRVLAFDPLNNNYMPENSNGTEVFCMRHVFIRGQTIDSCGGSQKVAVHVKKPWMFVVPESTILKHRDSC